MRFSGTKYRSCRCECKLNHHLHDSRLEANYCDQLELLCRAEEIYSYIWQRDFDLIVCDKLICVHRVDFVVFTDENNYEVHETKGYATRDWKIKRKLFGALYPNVKYIVISNPKPKRGGLKCLLRKRS